ncbi:hypothetical protein FQA39_LY13773 [Lamprigera yunnana]|nr:hypothetical protein FQA39_LY13773 [Lamprigera yunnana]
MEEDQENEISKKLLSNSRKQSYRELLSRIETLRANSDDNNAKEIGIILKDALEIDGLCTFNERVKYTEETLLQSYVVSHSSSVIMKCAENNDIFSVNYEPEEFVTKLLEKISNSDAPASRDWLNILDDARDIVPSSINFSSLYGWFDPTKVPEPKVRKERAKREAQGKVQKPQIENVCNLKKNEDGTDDSVNFIANILVKEYEKNNFKPIYYFDFVIDSENFTRTVENMFYTSFLFNDGKAKLDFVNEIPVIQPVHKRDLEKFTKTKGQNTQMILSFTMDDWEVLRDKEGHIEAHKKLLSSKK